MTRRPPPPPAHPRRQVLVALGFGAAAAALGSRLPELETPGDTDASAGGAGTDSSTETTTTTTPPEAALTAPPAMADAGPELGPDHVFDLVIANGRVIDPASGFDGPLDVGIDGGIITAIAPPGLKARELIDASNQVVAPGFIDILSYEPNPFGIWFKAADGVTTNLAMHGVNNYANAFFNDFEGKTPIHFGGAFHQHFLRGEDLGLKPEESPTAEMLTEFAQLARFNIGNGFAGVAFSPEYSPGTNLAELDALATVLAELGHTAFFHVRYSDPDPPGTSFEAIDEVIALAERTGIPAHIEHIASTGGTFVMADTIARIEAARASGLDITADVYPYDFWATTVASYRFAGDWQGRYRISYEDLQIGGTSERLTETTFESAKDENKLVAALGSIPEEDVQLALKTPWIFIGSDAIAEESQNNHPRASGTFSRVLGRYVRELGVLDLTTALAKMTIQPAQRIEAMIPAMARKGRLQRGADADIVVFDPNTIADRATVEKPASRSVGISHLLVDGHKVMVDGELDRTQLVGRALRSS